MAEKCGRVSVVSVGVSLKCREYQNPDYKKVHGRKRRSYMRNFLYKGINQRVRGQQSLKQDSMGRNLIIDSAERQTLI